MMDDQNLMILFNNKLTNISELKVADLKIELKKRGESTSGIKKDLYDRLRNYLIQQQEEQENQVDSIRENTNASSVVKYEETKDESMNIDTDKQKESIQTPIKRSSTNDDDDDEDENEQKNPKKTKHDDDDDDKSVEEKKNGEMQVTKEVLEEEITLIKSMSDQERTQSEQVSQDIFTCVENNGVECSKSQEEHMHEENEAEGKTHELNTKTEMSEDEELKVENNELIHNENTKETKVDDNNLNLGSSACMSSSTLSTENHQSTDAQVVATTPVHKLQRKRKWLNSDNLLKNLSQSESLTISSDTLKTFLSDTKTKQELEIQVSTNELDIKQTSHIEHETTKNDSDFTRKVIPNDDSKEDDEIVETQKSTRTVVIEELDELLKSEVKRESSVASNERKIELVANETPKQLPTNIIHIDNLTRPFTLNQLKELVNQFGAFDDEKFWISSVKSHCYVCVRSIKAFERVLRIENSSNFLKYNEMESAMKAQVALNNTRWPQSNPKTLVVKFAFDDDLNSKLDLERKVSKSSTQHSALRPEFREALQAPIKVAQERAGDLKLEREKNDRDKERDRVKEKKEVREVREKERVRERDTDRSNKKEKSHREEENKKKSSNRDDNRKKEEIKNEKEPPSVKPVREWDLPKLRKSRSRSREISMERKRSQDKKRKSDGKEKSSKREKDEPTIKQEDEQPVKMLDDLFKKTKSTPCIYWLPLTDEQIIQRQQEAAKRQQEREQRLRDKENQEKNLNEANEREKNDKSVEREEGELLERTNARKSNEDKKSDSKRMEENGHEKQKSHSSSEHRRRNDDDSRKASDSSSRR